MLSCRLSVVPIRPSRLKMKAAKRWIESFQTAGSRPKTSFLFRSLLASFLRSTTEYISHQLFLPRNTLSCDSYKWPCFLSFFLLTHNIYTRLCLVLTLLLATFQRSGPCTVSTTIDPFLPFDRFGFRAVLSSQHWSKDAGQKLDRCGRGSRRQCFCSGSTCIYIHSRDCSSRLDIQCYMEWW